MTALFLTALLAVPSFAKEKYAAGEDTVKLVDYFLNTETADLNVDLVPTFLGLLPATLPMRQREPYRAKRAELLGLKKTTDAKGRPPIRRAGEEPKEHCDIEEATPTLISWIKKLRFVEIDEDEEKWLEGQTRCTMCELTDEFSLTIYQNKPKKKGERPKVYYFVQEKDPLMALLARYREGHKNGGGTNFFSAGFIGACR